MLSLSSAREIATANIQKPQEKCKKSYVGVQIAVMHPSELVNGYLFVFPKIRWGRTKSCQGHGMVPTELFAAVVKTLQLLMCISNSKIRLLTFFVLEIFGE